MVTQLCTCGAQPPEDARFCHKCGRPLYELPKEQTEEPVAALPPPPPKVEAPPLPGVGFRNPRAVRTGMLVAGCICLLQAIPVPPLLQPIWVLILLLGGGFVAVYMYHRRSGDVMSVLGGARLGWMTGLFVFVVTLVLFTLASVAMGIEPSLRDALARSGPPEAADQFQAVLADPVLMTTMLLLVFAVFTIIPSAGGALAAKVLEKD